MANGTILTPGSEDPILELNPQYLEKDKFLSEYESEGEKAVVRENLDIYSKDTVYTKLESNIKIDESIKKAFDKYLSIEDPHGTLPIVQLMILGDIKNDGSIPFIAPQTGVDPVQDFHLTTKRFVSKLLKDHIDAEDPHHTLSTVEDILEQYVKLSETYLRNQLYTKNEIDLQNNLLIKKDGTTPFTKALIGADPQIESHLATKRYVDQVIYDHLVEVDPHGFMSVLNKRLASYAKANNVYDKSLTYSRVLLDSIIRGLVGEAAKEAINDHLNLFDPHHVLNEVRKEKYIKQDGSIPFKAPLKGIDAIDPLDLVTLHQVLDVIREYPSPVWITSGPVESTVGHVDDNTPLPERMTLQEIMDAIFYGKGICLDIPEHVTITESCEVTMCIHGSTAIIQHAELYQNGLLIYTILKEQFDNGCVTVSSLPILEDTEFIFKVFYTNGSVHEESKSIKCYMPVFVGLLPKWKFGNTITMDYLVELSKQDTEGTQNQFLNYGSDLKSFTFKYKFQDPDLRHPFVVLPVDYPDLDTMVTKSQSFELDAFDIIDMIPLQIPGVENDIIFKVYIYKQALSSLNLEITFNFKNDEPVL